MAIDRDEFTRNQMIPSPGDVFTTEERRSPKPDILVLLIRRLEVMESMFDSLIQRGLITSDEIQLAKLRSTLKQAERMIRIRARSNEDIDVMKNAASVVRSEITGLEEKLRTASA